MSTQTFSTLLLAITASTLTLGGCSTLAFDDAEPEKYAAYDCAELALLAESFRPETQDQLFADVSDLERRNEGSRDLGLQNRRARPYELEQARDRRSIALAQREKGCV